MTNVRKYNMFCNNRLYIKTCQKLVITLIINFKFIWSWSNQKLTYFLKEGWNRNCFVRNRKYNIFLLIVLHNRTPDKPYRHWMRTLVCHACFGAWWYLNVTWYLVMRCYQNGDFHDFKGKLRKKNIFLYVFPDV
jgi:hypothetical protein